jgi:peptide/nickel transport system permease protein
MFFFLIKKQIKYFFVIELIQDCDLRYNLLSLDGTFLYFRFMIHYVIRRLVLIPITLFFIILVNFVIINLAPGDPVTVSEITQQGQATRREGRAEVFGSDYRYLLFREYYGLTLPILYNLWPTISKEEVYTQLWELLNKRYQSNGQEIPVKVYDQLRITMGDQARFVMPHLVAIMNDSSESLGMRKIAARFFIRGGTRQGYVGPNITEWQKQQNRKIAQDNDLLITQMPTQVEDLTSLDKKIDTLTKWYDENRLELNYTPDFSEKVKIFFTETRFFRYMSRVVTLDFGTLREDPNKTVIYEVTRRFKYSLTLALLPMFLTFFLCLVLGFAMAIYRKRWPDHFLNVLSLILYAIPVFVVAPFLIEKVALNRNFPFTNIPIPISGFTSPDAIYNNMTASQRLFDVIQHIILPIIAIMYGSLAAQARLARTAILEVSRQDYVRTARAKGVSPWQIWTKHIGRNAAITIVTSIAGSLGIILGGSLIVETIFEINGFGKFFYEAVVNRDYNVIMFSALAGSFLTLVGYLIADIAYTLLDPRITLD